MSQVSQNRVRVLPSINSKNDSLRDAVDLLVQHGYITHETGKEHSSLVEGKTFNDALEFCEKTLNLNRGEATDLLIKKLWLFMDAVDLLVQHGYITHETGKKHSSLVEGKTFNDALEFCEEKLHLNRDLATRLLHLELGLVSPEISFFQKPIRIFNRSTAYDHGVFLRGQNIETLVFYAINGTNYGSHQFGRFAKGAGLIDTDLINAFAEKVQKQCHKFDRNAFNQGYDTGVP